MGKIATTRYITALVIAPAGFAVAVILSFVVHPGFLFLGFVWFVVVSVRFDRLRCPNCSSKIELWTRKKIGLVELDWWTLCPPKCHKCGQNF